MAANFIQPCLLFAVQICVVQLKLVIYIPTWHSFRLGSETGHGYSCSVVVVNPDPHQGDADPQQSQIRIGAKSIYNTAVP
jgi:hypothetical protein